MGKTKTKVDDKILKRIERDFPGDPALQQIHIARHVISMELKERGLSLLKYIEDYYQQI